MNDLFLFLCFAALAWITVLQSINIHDLENRMKDVDSSLDALRARLLDFDLKTTDASQEESKASTRAYRGLRGETTGYVQVIPERHTRFNAAEEAERQRRQRELKEALEYFDIKM